MVGDHDLEAPRAGGGDLVDGGDAAVDGHDEPAAFVRQALDGPERQPVALVEAVRQVPVDVGAELAQDRDRERGRADAVGVVVAVHADALAAIDGGADRCAGFLHVAEQERVMRRRLAVEERTGARRVREPAADEDASGRLRDAELACKAARSVRIAGADRPRHRTLDRTARAGRRPALRRGLRCDRP